MLRLCALVSAALVLVACSTSDSGSPSPSAGETPAGSAPYVEVDAGPVGLTATPDGSVWVVAAQGDTVARIPAGATAPDLTVDTPGTPLRATSAFGGLWVTVFGRSRLLHLDPATGEVVASIRTGAGPEGVAGGFGSVWLVVQDAGGLLRIDPATDAVTAEIPVAVARTTKRRFSIARNDAAHSCCRAASGEPNQ
jgi:streptogramin lyase